MGLLGAIIGLVTTEVPGPIREEKSQTRVEQSPRATPSAPSEDSDDPVVEGIQLVPVITGLDQPLYLTHAGDGSGRLFVVEQVGRVLVLDGPNDGDPEVYLDIRDRVRAQGEQGLLGLAFHPSFADNGYLFVSYTNSGGDSIISRFQVESPADGRPDPSDETVILTVQQPYANHNGGQIAFGPDGYLYVGLGDGGSGGDPLGQGQNLNTLLGALLRLDVDSQDLIPPDNPFVGREGRGELWAIGLRNPWRFSFDRATGDLYIADVGQSAREEINFQPANSPGGENYGWNIWEGSARYSSGDPVSDVTWPVFEYENGVDGCSVTGGYVYRGEAIPPLQGIYIFSDYCSGVLHGLVRQGDRWRSAPILETGFRVSSFGEDEDGELYVIDHQGGVYRLVPGTVPIPEQLLQWRQPVTNNALANHRG